MCMHVRYKATESSSKVLAPNRTANDNRNDLIRPDRSPEIKRWVAKQLVEAVPIGNVKPLKTVCTVCTNIIWPQSLV